MGITIVWFLGMTVCALFEDYNYYGSSIKDFEDDSGCAFEDDSGCAFGDENGMVFGLLFSLRG